MVVAMLVVAPDPIVASAGATKVSPTKNFALPNGVGRVAMADLAAADAFIDPPRLRSPCRKTFRA
jgi:hypothetical protein